MKKGCLISLGVFILILVVLLVGAKWFITEAFGPKERDVEISISTDRKIIGKETYNADFAAVFYEVELSLINKNDTSILGRTIFNREDWENKIEFLEIDDWTLLLILDNRYFQILGSNRKSKQVIDTTFSPLKLRYDILWTKENFEIPTHNYTGNSKIDSIQENKFYVTFNYRLGLNEPFEFYDQTILYTMNENTGTFETTKIFERKRKE